MEKEGSGGGKIGEVIHPLGVHYGQVNQRCHLSKGGGAFFLIAVENTPKKSELNTSK